MTDRGERKVREGSGGRRRRWRTNLEGTLLRPYLTVMRCTEAVRICLVSLSGGMANDSSASKSAKVGRSKPEPSRTKWTRRVREVASTFQRGMDRC